MLRYRDGDMPAFQQLYARHHGGVFRYLQRGCGGDEQAASELVQDVWMNLIRASSRYEPRALFTTWLYRLAHNRLIDYYRAPRPQMEPVDEDLPLTAPEQEQPEAQTEAAIQNRHLLRALNTLPIEQRQAFLLKEEGGLSLEEIGTVTGVGRETVKSRLRYALVKLRQELVDVI